MSRDFRTLVMQEQRKRLEKCKEIQYRAAELGMQVFLRKRLNCYCKMSGKIKMYTMSVGRFEAANKMIMAKVDTIEFMKSLKCKESE